MEVIAPAQFSKAYWKNIRAEREQQAPCVDCGTMTRNRYACGGLIPTETKGIFEFEGYVYRCAVPCEARRNLEQAKATAAKECVLPEIRAAMRKEVKRLQRLIRKQDAA